MPTDGPQPTPGLEPPLVATRTVLMVGISLLLFLGLSLLVMHLYFRAEIQRAVFVPPKPFAKPRLQTSDRSDLTALQTKQRSVLQSYAWIDRDKGIIAIPIEEAMERMAAREGDPYAPIGGTGPDAPTREETKQ